MLSGGHQNGLPDVVGPQERSLISIDVGVPIRVVVFGDHEQPRSRSSHSEADQARTGVAFELLDFSRLPSYNAGDPFGGLLQDDSPLWAELGILQPLEDALFFF